jgi:hypothetical protein
MSEKIKLEEDEFKKVAAIVQDNRRISRETEMTVQAAKTRLMEAQHRMDAVLEELGEKHGFNAGGRFDLDYKEKALVPMPVPNG